MLFLNFLMFVLSLFFRFALYSYCIFHFGIPFAAVTQQISPRELLNKYIILKFDTSFFTKCMTLPFLKTGPWIPKGFYLTSSSDDAQATSERKGEHPLLSPRGPAAFPQGISLREGKGELLGREVSLSKHYPCWHVHFMTSDKEINGFCLPDSAASACPAVLMFSSLSGGLPVLSGESSKPTPQTQETFRSNNASFFSPATIGNTLPHPNSHKLTG